MDAPAPDPCPRSTRPLTANVRAVAKLWRSSSEDGAVSTTPWFSVTKPHGDDSPRVTLTFGDQSASGYELDFCYEPNQGNSVVFEREVRPLIPGVFDGCNATVIATGANGSGKSHLIQGDSEEHGLAALAVNEIVLMAEMDGKVVSISMYEATSDRVFDLLGPTRQEVLIRGDAQRNIQLIGLSQVAITSVSEFQKLLDNGLCKPKPIQKILNAPPRRNHVGFIIYVLNRADRVVGKMNFVDLAGYEDLRRKSFDVSTSCEVTKINKSIYALHNVLLSLSGNEAHVPYRETKLTHMLQDSLGGTSRALIITCLNQSFCQDSICMVSLASRSCQNCIKGAPSSTKKPSNMASSCGNSLKGALSFTKKPNSFARSLLDSRKSQVKASANTTSKKQSVTGIYSAKKAINLSSALKARRLFEDAKRHESEKISSKTSSLDIISATEISFQEQERLCSDIVTHEVAIAGEHSLPTSFEDFDPIPVVDAFVHVGGDLTGITPTKSSLLEEGQDIGKENNCNLLNEGGSPPISTRLQELSNNLKMLCNSTPLYVETASRLDITCPTQVSADIVEPSTPDRCKRPHDNSFGSPWQTFSARSSRAKDSLVQEYLSFLNTASKEDLKKLKGIGEKRATYILDMREESPEPFKHLDDLKNIGLSGKQIQRLMKNEIGELFN